MASKQAAALPKNFLRIIASPKEVPEHLRSRFTKSDGKMVGGTIDRRRGIIYLLEIPGVRGYTRFGVRVARSNTPVRAPDYDDRG